MRTTGSRACSVSPSIEAVPGPYACLSAADTGGGITEQDLGKVFDPPFTTKFHGRSTGLAVVLGIARAHGGAVVVDSQPGHGSVFRVYFPWPVARI